jgi:uncharacterized protein (DUF1919 family)
VGAYLTDLDKTIRKLTAMGVQFAKENPVMGLIENHETGALKPELLGEKVLSAIAEFIIDEDGALKFISEMKDFLNKELDSVATMSVISRADDTGDANFIQRLKEAGFGPYPNGKVNIGLALA